MQVAIRFAACAAAAAMVAACSGGDAPTASAGTQKTQLLTSSVAVQADYRTAVQQLYVAYFGRPADPGGETNFMAALAAAGAPSSIAGLEAAYRTNATVRALVDAFGTSQESKDLYGSGDTRAFVTAIYGNLLGRAPDDEGLTFWADAIDQGQLTRGNAALSIMAGALANTTAQGQIDGQLVQNRISVATTFTETLRTQGTTAAYVGNDAAAAARTMLSGVSATTVPSQYQSSIASSIDALVVSAKAWLNFGRDPQHSAAAAYTPTQSLSRLVWRADVDLQPTYSTLGSSPTPNLLATGHYGSPVITGNNTVVFPVRVTSAGTHRVEARSGADGSLVWQANTDYVPAVKNRTYNVALTPSGRAYFPGAGGKLYYRDNADSATGEVKTVVFYGDSDYAANPAAFDNSIVISTPLVTDSKGNVYFGYLVKAANPKGIAIGGFARIDASGKGTWVSASDVTGDSTANRALAQAAPALSPDGRTLYAVAAANGATATSRVPGWLVALDSTTLAAKAKVQLKDPKTGGTAVIAESGTSSPLVGPDGRVFFGILGVSGVSHAFLGWLLQFDADLATQRATGGFGWDYTPSVIPSNVVGGYTGSSSYLLAAKYNEYSGGQHLMAILDPNATQQDPIDPSMTVMKIVISVLGPSLVSPNSNERHEWCVNTVAADPATRSVFMNSSDGYLYRWDLSTNTLSEKFSLNTGYYQSYTPIALGPDGKIYAINNAQLTAVGK